MAKTKTSPQATTTSRAASKPAAAATPKGGAAGKSGANGGKATTSSTARPQTRAATTVTSRKVEPSTDAIARRAYEIWMRKGCPAGQDLENWLQAKAELVGV